MRPEHSRQYCASLSDVRAFQSRTGRYFGAIVDIEEARMLRGGLLWLLGIPLPIILLLYFLGVFH
ncbi:hypothetical protein ACLBYG_23050 [Methylobacterium sp. D53M]|uniref:hypothetical protein n=1 Tax=Methylobacterium sp. 275MFSha3.1 TaxID=1502746 RepID=UPI000AD1CA6D|nr:hypothetical protein [Methylobacterium sp. 275MFSha3.1]